MTISFAQHINDITYVYDDNNELLFIRPGTLVDYTRHTVSIMHADAIYVYDEVGNFFCTENNKC